MRPRDHVRRRSAHLAALTAVVVLGLPGVALAGAITPEHGGSPNADSINTLYTITLIIAVVILIVVEGSLVYCLRKFKAGKGKKAAQIHGNTNLELGWTVGAALILVILSVVTFVMLSSITDPKGTGPRGLQNLAGEQLVASTEAPTPPNGKALHICVTGRQYIWRYTYSTCGQAGLGKVYAYESMVVPEDTTVILDIQSTDVAHSWWIPKLGGKFDAIPGQHNFTWFKAPKAGAVYYGHCAELCGRNHADMNAHVRVLTAGQYQNWFARQKQLIDQANRAAEQQRKQLQKSNQL